MLRLIAPRHDDDDDDDELCYKKSSTATALQIASQVVHQVVTSHLMKVLQNTSRFHSTK